MKKNLVLFILFILPIVAYLFFASGVNSFITLPTITPNIPNVDAQWKSLNGEKVSLDKKITILGFAGQDILANSGNFFTLNQKIYNKYRAFKDFQFVFIAPLGTEDQAQRLLKELGKISDVSGYHFVFTTPEAIKSYHANLKLLGKLNNQSGTPYVYIVDKKRNLRGRKGKSDKGKPEYKEGYNTTSAADLHNDMMDDVKIILAEYRLALKRNSADRKI
ncbi:hypothetical protein IVB69_06630 [Flavobacterium sp. J49]|uniref:hypothetical protein n=1 Tax=Flavobacterium sp. J49 TaxID=2718534 RepID=UPI0015930071|nr:hypothetical protein [Flavobacterium sp. J49]MBF6641149.1 hypothetical protein [Flavobacterium sp. J49]NIC02396.1 hypothetical protein [Flavobacterium sp. J49]